MTKEECIGGLFFGLGLILCLGDTIASFGFSGGCFSRFALVRFKIAFFGYCCGAVAFLRCKEFFEAGDSFLTRILSMGRCFVSGGGFFGAGGFFRRRRVSIREWILSEWILRDGFFRAGAIQAGAGIIGRGFCRFEKMN